MMLKFDTRNDNESYGKRCCLICAKDPKHVDNCSCACHFIVIYGEKDPYPVSETIGVLEVHENVKKELERNLGTIPVDARRQFSFFGNEGLPKASEPEPKNS